MDISRSNNWTAQALVFSGRTNPVWTLDAVAAAELVALWERLEPRQGPAAVPPPLGYRGVVLRASDDRVWSAHGGTVVLQQATDQPGDGEVRDDPGRVFEQRLLASAPPDAVPAILPDNC